MSGLIFSLAIVCAMASPDVRAAGTATGSLTSVTPSPNRVAQSAESHTVKHAEPPLEPFVIKPKFIDATRASSIITQLFPNVRSRADPVSGSVVVFARRGDVAAIRSTFDALDVKGATVRTVQAFPVRSGDGSHLTAALRRMYPGVRVDLASKHLIVASGSAEQLGEIAGIITSVDSPPSPMPTTAVSSEGVSVTAARPLDVAHQINAAIPGVHAATAGTSIVITGPPASVTQAKSLVAELDIPPSGARYTQVYRLRAVDAESVADLIRRTFPDVRVDVDAKLNAFAANATNAQQQRIAAAVSQLDGGTVLGPPGLPVSQPGHSGPAAIAANGTVVEVVTLRAAAPGLPSTTNAPSTTASDIAGAVLSALRPIATDLNITSPPNNPSQLIVTGSADTVRLAKQVIAQLDVAQKLVVLDTEILEVDETSVKNLGLSLGQNPLISTTYTETSPAPAINGLIPPLLGLQQLSRTPFAFSAQLNLLVQHGNARILADPRITTISGRTATIRAGDNITILTTTGGATGTIATTQLQTFQTGVTLDITPVINADNFITVALHPVVNSLTGTSNGVPQISTRDTQTTVAMQADQTLVIGGLIQDNTTRSETKIPFFGDLPLIGKAFRDTSINGARNELIITVTPHVVNPGETSTAPPQATLSPPAPQPLPTLPPGAPLPTIPPHAPTNRRATVAPTAWPTPAPLPTASAVPTPAPTPAPSPRMTPSATQTPVTTIMPSSGLPTPGSFLATPSPSPAPSVFLFAAPTSMASPTANAIQILSATFSPTNVKNNTNVTCTAVTTKSVAKVTIGYGGFTTQLSSISAGQWQASYNFATTGLPFGQSQVPLTLTATGFDGTSNQITIPVSILQ